MWEKNNYNHPAGSGSRESELCGSMHISTLADQFSNHTSKFPF
ncbi:hypothetical protein C5167_016237 [Papaver somniferum]|nr:hypothetical protein C5167_016237 [Papaver somniferum]